MPENKIHASIVTPEENIFEGETNFVLVPALNGALGMLPGHIPMVARLSTGIVKIGKGDDARYFAIQSGYIEFLFNRANILTEDAIETKYEERERALKEIKKKHKIVQKVTEETKKVAWAMTNIKDLKN
ncbi:MAG: ATP synthase F1 subunit epsilon [Actinomycetia bacterium]|nr:ATP synthase F1 subunit epsilon [Actinomycetes bacterium]